MSTNPSKMYSRENSIGGKTASGRDNAPSGVSSTLLNFWDEANWVYKPIHVPKPCHVRIVVWEDLSIDAVDLLLEAINADHIKQLLTDTFHLSPHRKDQIILDFYFYCIQFAKAQKMSKEQISAFFSIMKNTFEAIVDSPLGKLDDVFKYFTKLVLCHSIMLPPWNIELFKANDVRVISEYAINTLFRHFWLYKYAFTPKLELDLSISYCGGSVKSPTVSPKATVEHLPDAHDSHTTKESRSERDHEAERDDARENLKAYVRSYLESETLKIEDTVESQMKRAVDALQRSIEPYAPTQVKKKNSLAKKKLETS